MHWLVIIPLAYLAIGAGALWLTMVWDPHTRPGPGTIAFTVLGWPLLVLIAAWMLVVFLIVKLESRK